MKLPRLINPAPLTITSYSAELVLAEKIVTALQRGTANTRWRDFVDIAALAHTSLDTETLTEAIARVARHRETPIALLAEVLDDTPSEFDVLLSEVIAFADRTLGRL